MRLIDADALKDIEYINKGNFNSVEGIWKWIDNAPTVIPEEFKPLIDKVVDILPELTSAVIEQLPQIISSNIKCSECSYYKDTWNVIPRPHGKWIDLNSIVDKAKCSNCKKIVITEPFGHFNFCPNCGADMRGAKE